MPRYEVLTHIAVELDGTTPEEAAAVFKRAFLGGAGLALRGLAVWPSAGSSTPVPLPPPLQQQLADLFVAVARHAAVEEDAFRARVADIFAQAESGAGSTTSAPEPEAAATERQGAEEWEAGGGGVGRVGDESGDPRWRR